MLPLAVVAAAVMAIPAHLVDAPLVRIVRVIDDVILAVTAVLIGLMFAIRARGKSPSARVPDGVGRRGQLPGRRLPVCDHAVVALVGTSGAFSWWSAVQPGVGLVAIGVLVWTLR